MRDIKSKSVPLKLAIIDIMHYIDKNTAIEILLETLKDPVPAIKNSVLISLRILRAKGTIKEITPLLHHSHEWVRHNAAYTLWAFGKEGLSILKDIKPEDELCFEIAQKVIKTPQNTKEHYCRVLL